MTATPKHVRRAVLVEDVHVLRDGEECPAGCVTYGQLILEEMGHRRPETERQKRIRHHAELYERWKRMAARHLHKAFGPDHPMFQDVRAWERYVCRFIDLDAKCGQWFDDLDAEDRIDLCRLSRESRRRDGVSRNENDALSYLVPQVEE